MICDGASSGLVATAPAARRLKLPANPDERAGAGAAEPKSALPPTNVPEPISELIGRDDELREILSSSRSLSLPRSGSNSFRAQHRRYLSRARSARSSSC